MKTPLRILHLQYSPNDAVRVQSILEQGDFNCSIDRFETENEFATALERNTYDVTLSEFILRSYDGARALKLVSEKQIETPFILVSGTIREDPIVVLEKVREVLDAKEGK